MSFRSAQIFVQPKTARLLRLVTKLYPTKNDAMASIVNTTEMNATPDQMADAILSVAITDHYPLAIELAKKQDALEKEYQDKAKQ